ncbi:MAG: tripartite tricarboxylate transporter TctB family protein [Betaproteobacteria bacterium]|nr:MAG: tripartite tricarboxylate transporter TctB family protein [Betaproteobacteria bacterium]
MLSRDGWAGLAVLAASLFLFALTLGLKDNPLVPIGPGFYPRIVLGISVLLAVAVVLADWRRRGRARDEGRFAYGLVAAMFAAFALYVGALPYAGFRLATFAYVAGANALLDPPRGARGWLRCAIVGLVTMGVVYFAFERYLTVLLPRGRWTGF